MSVSPFLLSSGEQVYQQWRNAKRDTYLDVMGSLMVDIQNAELNPNEYQRLVDNCRTANFSLYRMVNPDLGDKAFVRTLGQKLGLNHLDGNLCADNDSITSLQTMDTGRHAAYIPYTNRRLSWHTDGYYNKPDQQIRGILMHCARPAAEGGENLLMDHEMAYMQMRDENPDYIKAFMSDRTMTIPPNIENGVEIRGAETGPVFSIDSSGHLHMRFSARGRNIEWYDDELTREAVEFLNSVLNINNPYVTNYRLQAGEGIICNNVLHCRTGFKEDAEHKRLLYRARYFDRVVD